MIKIDEKDLEGVLESAMNQEKGIEALKSRGLILKEAEFTKVYRQTYLGKYGISDLIRVSLYRQRICIEVIELKVVEFDLSHLTQLGRYMSFVKRAVAHSLNISSYKIDVGGILIVSGFYAGKDYVWMDSIINSNIAVYNTEYGLAGMKFERIMPNGWHLSEASTDPGDFIEISELSSLYRMACRADSRDPQPF